MAKSIIATLYIHKTNQKTDIEIPLNITANELVVAVNEGFHLGINTNDIKQCYLKTEHPIALLKGNKTIEEFQLHDGTVIHFTR